jgi:pimeloyl-ACP methyl ester carboxylesterase
MAQKTHWKITAMKLGLRLLEKVSPRWAGQVALNISLTPQKHSPSDMEQQILNRAWRVVVYHGDDRLSGYVWDGDGATVLLVHGWEGGAHSLTPLVAPLQTQGFRVVAFDAPAHGISHAKHTNLVDMGQSVREAIDQFGPVYAIVAHSMGGAATMFAAAEGLCVEKIVLLGAPSKASNIFARFAMMFDISDRVLQEMHDGIARLVGKPVEYFSVETVARGIKIPGLVVHDRRDPVVAFTDGEAIAANWKGARFFPTDGLGHRNIRHNAAVIHEITDFLTEEVRELRMVGD